MLCDLRQKCEYTMLGPKRAMIRIVFPCSITARIRLGTFRTMKPWSCSGREKRRVNCTGTGNAGKAH